MKTVFSLVSDRVSSLSFLAKTSVVIIVLFWLNRA